MIYAANPTLLIRWVSLVVFVASWLVVWRQSPEAANDLWKAKSTVLTVPGVIVFLLTFRPVFRFIHSLTLAKAWLFPMLDGEWEGEIHSNWPRIRAMLEAARGQGGRFDALSDPTPPEFDTGPVKVRATIESGLFDYRMKIIISETRESRTIFVKPEWRRPERPRLYYMYEQQEHGAVAVTDRARHQGAACLDYDPDTQALTGAYWTGRQGELGLNTAGRLRLVRRA